MRRSIQACLALALAFAAPAFAPAQAKQVGSFTSGNWQGGAYTSDQSGAFSHCAASSVYRSGITMFVSVSRTFTWSLGFSHPSWTLTPKQQIALRFRIDSGPWLNATAQALFNTMLEMPMPSESLLVHTFRSGKQMQLNDGVRDYSFNLKGTGKLLTALSQCVTGNQSTVVPATSGQSGGGSGASAGTGQH